MIQGTGSHVGKSLLVAGLCRTLARRGLAVAPFKPQNMSNNAAVAVDGGEIGRAQTLQARAACRDPSVHMNPVLLKPEAEAGAQVVVQGRVEGRVTAAEYFAGKADLLPRVMDSFAKVAATAEIVLVEGAGSPAETNLRAGDIANMGFAAAAEVPVVLAADIDRGGVIAALVGTHAVLAPDDTARIRGFVINKFRGDAGLFDTALADIAGRTGWRSYGVVPWFAEAHLLPAEDTLGLGGSESGGGLRIAVPRLPRIANFDDLDPLRAEPGVDVVVVESGEPVPADTDLVLLPGSKSTVDDLNVLRAEGWDVDIAAHHRRGGTVLGLCAGYQMLGRTVSDPLSGSADGLGLLDVTTVMEPDKTTRSVTGRCLSLDASFAGYEIHMGATDGPDCVRPFARIDGRDDGAVSADGRVMGTYVHGLFASDELRAALLGWFGRETSDLRFEAMVDATLDRLADHLEATLDIDGLLDLARG